MLFAPWRLGARILLLVLLLQPVQAAEGPPGYAVASAHPQATEAGLLMLAAGGNAFDAAVAVSAALAVVEPAGSGLGGGGFWLLHQARDGLEVMVDGRERAPYAASADMFLDDKGEYVEGSSRDGARAAAIPGEPAALAHIAARYGRLPLAASLAPAIRLAREGFVVDSRMQRLLAARARALAESPAAAGIFLPQGQPLAAGSLLRQPDLAVTLERLARDGADGFYRGETAKALVRGVRAAGGIWSARDLEEYRVVERNPLVLRYRGMRIVTAPPPSAGGIVMGLSFNTLAGYELERMSQIDRRHLLVEVLRRAYRDRAAYLGDPDFVATPLQLLSPAYANSLRESIRLTRATPSIRLAPVGAAAGAGANTTHFSVIDAEGNRVAATLSVNQPFGCGVVAPGTGVVLNNEMDDFAVKPLTPNAYGLVGASANAIAPGKRMLSSMSPTFVELGDRVAVLGTPGGSRIITMVLQGILAFADGADAREIVSRPRFHHQYLPDEIVFERGALGGDEQQALRRRGHALREVDSYGNMQAVLWDRKQRRLQAASDPRGIGMAKVQQAAAAPAAASP